MTGEALVSKRRMAFVWERCAAGRLLIDNGAPAVYVKVRPVMPTVNKGA